jgi:multiple sugar transport system permease protein
VRAVRDRERLGLWLMAAPFLVGVLVLVALPALLTFAMSLFRWDLVRPPRFLGLENFRELLQDTNFRAAMRNSLTYLAIAVPLRLVLAVGIALLLQPRFRGAATVRAAVFLPAVIPDVAYALLWLWILNPLYGPLNLALEALGLPTPGWLSVAGPARWGVIVMGVFQLGETFLVAFAVRRFVPQQLYEVAAEQGAGPWSRTWRVTLPLMMPTLLLLLLRDTALSLQATFVPALLVTEGGPPPNGTLYLPLFVYRNAFSYFRYGYAAAATVWIFALTASIVWLQYRVVRRFRAEWA